MRKLLKFLTGRLFWSVILISAQVALLIYGLFYGATKSGFIMKGLLAISWIMTVVVVSRDENPAYKIAWMVVFMVLPLYGGFLYILIGNKRFTSRISNKWGRFVSLYKDGMKDVKVPVETLKEEDPMLARQQNFIADVSDFPVCTNTKVHFFPLGDDWFPDMLEEISKAKKFILLEFFIIDYGEVWDQVLALLKKKQAEGVEIRLMYDDVGTIKFLPNNFERKMNAMGIKTVAFNPLKPHINSRMNCRDHRKVLVIDGDIGYTGGVNLADEYVNRKILYGHWKDYAVKLEGQAVRNLTLMFMQLWTYSVHEPLDFSFFMPTSFPPTDGYVQPFGDNPLDDRNVAESAYLQIISTAKDYVWITTPYLVLDNEMVTLLCIAAKSGVDVRIVVPHIPDKWYVFSVTRSYYRQLVFTGVKVYEYTPGFIHGKTIVSDDKVAIIGTINADYRTFYLNFENGVAFYHSSIIKDVARDVERTCTLSHRVNSAEVKRTPFIRRVGRALLRLFSPLL
jgi:cardiolipin synthase